MGQAGSNAGVPVLHNSIPFLPFMSDSQNTGIQLHVTFRNMGVLKPSNSLEGPSTCDTLLSKVDHHQYLHACQTTALSSQHTCFSCTIPNIIPLMAQ